MIGSDLRMSRSSGTGSARPLVPLHGRGSRQIDIDYPPPTRGRVVVWGLLTRHPFGGMIWQVLHHLAALRRLGFDVWYVEDSDSTALDPVTLSRTLDHLPAVDFLASHMELAGFGERWAFRVPCSTEILSQAPGVTLDGLYKDADAAFNLCGAQELLPVHTSIQQLIYLQTDPVKPQIRIATGNERAIEAFKGFDHLFTYGTNMGSPDCPVPIEHFDWIPTFPPVIVDWWATEEPPRPEGALTTVASWGSRDGMGNDIDLNGHLLTWRKEKAFKRFADVGMRSTLPLEVAMRGANDEQLAMLRSRGWRLRRASSLDDMWAYRDYIRGSRGEFSVGKEQVVATRSGWFSDRTVCYLAAGRPAIVEDTGFSKKLPTGEGLLAFSTEDEALAAIDAVAGDYERHSLAARAIAEEYFAGEKVLSLILGKAGMS